MIRFRELPWEARRGLQRAPGIAGRYDILKNHGEDKYSLFYAPIGTCGGESLGDKFPSYSAAQKAAEEHHQKILGEWIIQSPREEARK